MKPFRHFRYLSVFVILLTVVFNYSIVQAGNDIVTGFLRLDYANIPDSGDYTVKLIATVSPQSSRGFTTNWIAIASARFDTYSFLQTGIMADQNGLHWFVEAPSDWGVWQNGGPGLTCEQGEGVAHQYPDGTWAECIGNGGLIQLNQWTMFELVSYHTNQNGYYEWFARVYDQNGTAIEVAHTWIRGMDWIGDAEVAGEEAWSTILDPKINMGLFMYDPQYMSPSGTFVSWPLASFPTDPTVGSDGYYKNHILADSTFCPSYIAASPNVNGNERYWYTGNNGAVCDWRLFPPIQPYGIYDDTDLIDIDYRTNATWVHAGPSPSWVKNWNSTLSYSNSPKRYYSF